MSEIIVKKRKVNLCKPEHEANVRRNSREKKSLQLNVNKKSACKSQQAIATNKLLFDGEPDKNDENGSP